MSSSESLLLLDTNVVVHLLRDNSLGRSIDSRFDLRNRPERPLVSVVTVGELLALAEKLGWGLKKKARLQELVRELVVVDVNSQPVLEAYASIDSFLRGQGRPVGQNDMWIAATARATGATLVTTDKDFDPLDPRFLQRSWIDPGRVQ